MAAADIMSQNDTKTMLLRRVSGLLPQYPRQFCHAAPALLPYNVILSAPLPRLRGKGLGDGVSPTDNPDDGNSPHQCRPTDNFGHQNGGYARQALPQMPPPKIIEGAAPQTAAKDLFPSLFGTPNGEG